MNRTARFICRCPARWLVVSTVLVLGMGSPARAASTLFFDGAATFTVIGAQLVVDGVIKDTEGIGSPELSDSHFYLATVLTDTSSDAVFTSGTFAGGPGVTATTDAGATLLLAADIDGLTVAGPNGSDSGGLVGQLTPTGGLFSTPAANLFSVVLNLDTVFGPTMFEDDFTGHADGRIVAVPEPATWPLMALGLLVLVTRRIVRKRQPSRSVEGGSVMNLRVYSNLGAALAVALCAQFLPPANAQAAVSYPMFEIASIGSDNIQNTAGELVMTLTVPDILSAPGVVVPLEPDAPLLLVADYVGSDPASHSFMFGGGNILVGDAGSPLLVGTVDSLTLTSLATTLGPGSGMFSASLTFTDGSFLPSAPPASGSMVGSFFSATSDTFSDDFTATYVQGKLGPIVPEPLSFGLVASGLFGLICAVPRRRA